MAWNDINNVQFSKRKNDDEPEEKKLVTGVEEYEEEEKTNEPIADIIEAVNWIEGEFGFTFNEICFLEVKGEFHNDNSEKLQTYTKVTGELWVINSDETEENLNIPVEGFLDDNGIAKCEVKLQYGKQYHEELDSDINATCKYIVKNIQHCLGGEIVDSEPLEMPVDNKEVDFDFSR